MRSSWQDSKGASHKQVSPLSLLVTGFSPVQDVRLTLTPDLKSNTSHLLLIDLGAGKNRLGGSALAQVYNQLGDTVPDLDDPALFRRFFEAIQALMAQDKLLSYHDRSDGGLLATVSEMAFAGRKGLKLVLDSLISAGKQSEWLAPLFTEELGAVIEVAESELESVQSILEAHGLREVSHHIGQSTESQTVAIHLADTEVFSKPLPELNRAWSELSYRMQAKRDNPDCAQEAFDALLDTSDGGLLVEPSYHPEEDHAAHLARFNITGSRPRIAILREQGTNGQNEMAFAFDRAGFEAVDLHMTDLLNGNASLDRFAGLVACGGFSYGDVLGAGSGWAKSIRYNASLKDQFAAFFARPDSFSLGVCNGCQMLAQLKDIIPGAEDWPQFSRNRSEQFEARFSNVAVLDSPSLFFSGMSGSLLPIPVAHGEGRADFSKTGSFETCRNKNLIAMCYIDGSGQAAEHYPANPNGSPEGATAFTTSDGRVTIMMPHPERCFRAVQMSYCPEGQFPDEAGPWLKFFQNARSFLV